MLRCSSRTVNESSTTRTFGACTFPSLGEETASARRRAVALPGSRTSAPGAAGRGRAGGRQRPVHGDGLLDAPEGHAVDLAAALDEQHLEQREREWEPQD